MMNKIETTEQIDDALALGMTIEAISRWYAVRQDLQKRGFSVNLKGFHANDIVVMRVDSASHTIYVSLATPEDINHHKVNGTLKITPARTLKRKNRKRKNQTR